MTRYSVAFFSLLSVLDAAPATFYRDVLPILQKRCQGCHRQGEAAPMPLMTYEQTRPWAKAIRQAVLLKTMPPWLADPRYGKFSNDRSLSQQEIDLLVSWADKGASRGNQRDAPEPAKFQEGWNISKPDAVLEMAAPFEVPASGAIEYQHFLVPTGFKEDKWIQALEMRPGDRGVVHHAAIFIRPPGSKWISDIKAGEPYGTKNQRWFLGRSADDELLGFYVPGGMPYVLSPGQAKLIKAGSDLIFQIHYTANGKATLDQSRVGLVFADKPPAERVYSLTIANTKLRIPPLQADFPFQAEFTLPRDVTLIGLNPHMHLRGKSFEFRAIYPDGRSEILLRVPKYSFSWQLYYYLRDQMKLPQGTRIECNAIYDNSANNPNNPDPRAEVRWGDQSWEEMLVGTLEVGIPLKMNLADLFIPQSKPTN